VTLNDLVVPVGVPVIFEIAAVDVIHSLNFPNLRQKMDAVPGVINRLWFEAAETGEVEIACAQHCGAAHYKMKGWLKIVSRDDYASWAQEAMANAVQAYDPEDFEAHWGWDWRNK
jgi:cytochrome c oxidase subunit 2